MSAFARRVAEITGVAEEGLARLGGESVSEVLLVRHANGGVSVAKKSPFAAAEAAMLRAIAGHGVPAPSVESEHETVLMLAFVENDAVFSPRAWVDVARELRKLHGAVGTAYGWPVDYTIGTVAFHNRESGDWPRFWGEQRLVATAAVLDRPWRERVERLAARLPDLLPASPPAALLHGDLWSGNILVNGGRVVGLIDPACYHGDAEVDLAMLALFSAPPNEFWERYGALDPGWRERQPIYQLFPALVHVRLWGASYYKMVDRLLAAVGA
jgi:fructosamine-3-kinase